MNELETLKSLLSMRKRVWIPTDHVSGFQELADGAVPMWWIKERIQKLEISNSN